MYAGTLGPFASYGDGYCKITYRDFVNLMNDVPAIGKMAGLRGKSQRFWHILVQATGIYHDISRHCISLTIGLSISGENSLR